MYLEYLVLPRQMGLKLDFCPTVGRFSPFTRSNRTNHRLGMRTSDFKVGQIRTWLRLAENPGSNRNQEGIHSSCQSEDTSKKNVENSIFADFGIQYLSQFVVIYNQVRTSLWPYQKSLLPQFFLSIKHFLVPIAIFFLLSLFFNGISAAGAGGFQWSWAHSESHKKRSRKATTSQ